MNQEIELNFQKTEKEFARFAKLISNMRQLLNNENCHKSTQNTNDAAHNSGQEFNREYHYIMSQLRGCTEKLHYYLCDESLKNDSLEDDTFVGIPFYADTNRLFLKLPLLPCRNDVTTTVNGRFVIKPYSCFGRDALLKRLDYIEQSGKCDFDSFGYKTVYYVFAYNTNSKYSIADSDNHDTKAIHDAICSKTPTGDANQFCKVIYDTVVTDCVAEGTYIAMVQGKNTDLTTEKILNCWYQKF